MIYVFDFFMKQVVVSFVKDFNIPKHVEFIYLYIFIYREMSPLFLKKSKNVVHSYIHVQVGTDRDEIYTINF